METLFQERLFSTYYSYLAADQSSLENAFPNELTLLAEPVWMHLQGLKEEKGTWDKCPT